MRLASGGVQRDFATAAERQSEGRGHHRLGRKFDGLRHALKLTDGEVNVVPLFLLDRHEQQHQVGADGEIRRVVGDDEGVEPVARSARLQRLEDQRNNVGAERVHFRVELDAAHAFAQVHQRGAGIFLDHAVGLFCDFNRPDSRRHFHGLEMRVGQIEVCFWPDGVFRSSAYQDLFPEASSFSTLAATGRPSFFMRATVASTPAASHSSKGPSSQLKPRCMARSISTTESEISGMRLAEYVHRSDSAAQRNAAALSAFGGAPPPSLSKPSNMRRRAPVSSTFFAISSAANFGLWRG